MEYFAHVERIMAIDAGKFELWSNHERNGYEGIIMIEVCDRVRLLKLVIAQDICSVRLLKLVIAQDICSYFIAMIGFDA